MKSCFLFVYGRVVVELVNVAVKFFFLNAMYVLLKVVMMASSFACVLPIYMCFIELQSVQLFWPPEMNTNWNWKLPQNINVKFSVQVETTDVLSS